VGVAGRDGVPDTEKLERALRVADRCLRLDGQKGRLIERAAIRRGWPQVVVKRIKRHCAIVHDNLVVVCFAPACRNNRSR